MVSRMHARGVRDDERCKSAIARSGNSSRCGTGSWLVHAMVNVVPGVATRSTCDLKRRFLIQFLLLTRRSGFPEQQRQPLMGVSRTANMRRGIVNAHCSPRHRPGVPTFHRIMWWSMSPLIESLQT
jgi:hypothetical protein